MSRLLLVRHGETKLKSSLRLWGRTDVELNAEGLKQAEHLRDRLATEKIDVIYSSSLKRALATADIIASRHKLGVIPCDELREVDFGDAEGMTYEEVNQSFPEFVEMRRAQGTSVKYPGGESMDDLSRRVSRFTHRLKQHEEEDNLLIVAHAGVARILICHLLELEASSLRRFRLDLASLSIVYLNSRGAIISLLNDTSHLRVS
jgi:alpha-ribazole phosphatase